jgi:hypothetical protein
MVYFNEECPICLENINDTALVLICNHRYHYNCIINYLESEVLRLIKYQDRRSYICCKYLKCPLCRKSMCCQDIKNIIYNKYIFLKRTIKNTQKEIKNLQTASYMFTIKFKCKLLYKRLCKNINRTDIYNYLLEDETLLENIMQKKMDLDYLKEKFSTYEKLYYRQCFCK